MVNNKILILEPTFIVNIHLILDRLKIYQLYFYMLNCHFVRRPLHILWKYWSAPNLNLNQNLFKYRVYLFTCPHLISLWKYCIPLAFLYSKVWIKRNNTFHSSLLVCMLGDPEWQVPTLWFGSVVSNIITTVFYRACFHHYLGYFHAWYIQACWHHKC